MQARFIQTTLSLMASDTGQELRELLEFLFVVGIIGVLATFALHEHRTLTARAQVTEALSLASTAKIDVVAYRAEYGRWPADADEAGNATLLPHDQLGSFVMTATLQNRGVIDVQMLDDGVAPDVARGILSFRLGLSTTDDGAPIVPICGHATPPPGIAPSGENTTTIGPKFLPYACKEH